MRVMYTRPFFYFFVLLAATACLMFLHVRGWLSPVESAIAETPRPFVYVLKGAGDFGRLFFSFFGSVSRLNDTNAKLAEQVRNLQEQNVQLQQYKLENDLLKKELAYRAQSKMTFISADVIAHDPSGLGQVVTIDIGSRDGAAKGDAVVSQGVLVGKIVEANYITSKVQLVTDPESNIDAQNSITGDSGILRGSYGSGLEFDMISQNAKVTAGDEVVTAGLTAEIPKGILIGSIGEVLSQKNDLLQKASIIPSVDMKNLQFLAVVKK